MKIVDVPKPITVKFPLIKDGSAEPREITFKEFCLMHMDNYGSIKSPSQVRQASKVFDAVEAAKKGADGQETIALEDAEYELLKSAVGEVKFVPGVSRQLVPYFDAIDKAQDVKK